MARIKDCRASVRKLSLLLLSRTVSALLTQDASRTRRAGEEEVLGLGGRDEGGRVKLSWPWSQDVDANSAVPGRASCAS